MCSHKKSMIIYDNGDQVKICTKCNHIIKIIRQENRESTAEKKALKTRILESNIMRDNT